MHEVRGMYILHSLFRGKGGSTDHAMIAHKYDGDQCGAGYCTYFDALSCSHILN
jgi:hypothetical protein